MLRALFWKQMIELNQSFFQDRKTGKAKSKAAVKLSIIGFAAFLLVILGGIFFVVAYQTRSVLYEGLDWLYFLIMGSIAAALGIFGSVFNTYASLYQAKDTELLLAMPIPARDLLLIRLSGVYLMGVIYSAVVYIPTLIVYAMCGEGTVLSFLTAVWFGVLLSAFVLILSCILGWLVAQISGRLRHKSLITVAVSLLFMVGYYYFYFRSSELLNNIALYAAEVGGMLEERFPLLVMIGSAATGKPMSVLIVTLAVLLMVAVVFRVLERSFLKLALGNSVGRQTRYKEKRMEVRSASFALLRKEGARFLASSTYMLNCAMGTIFMVIGGAVLLVRREWIAQTYEAFRNMLLGEGIDLGKGLIAVGIVVVGCTLISMNDISTLSVTMEGKNLWLTQSLPITSWQILKSKLTLHFLITGIPAAFFVSTALIALRPAVIEGVLLCMVLLLFVLLSDSFGLFLNLKRPKLEWTSETAAIKQNTSVLFAMLSGWLLTVLMGAVYICTWKVLGSKGFLILWIIIFALLASALLLWLKRRGTRLLEEM